MKKEFINLVETTIDAKGVKDYYLNSKKYLEVLVDFFFIKRKMHLKVLQHWAKKPDEEITPELVTKDITQLLIEWLEQNPNALKFYGAKIGDPDRPNLAAVLNNETVSLEFIVELTSKLMKSFDQIDETISEIFATKAKTAKNKEEAERRQAEWDALTPEQQQAKIDQGIVDYLDYWAARGHHVN
jgi:hypothetical protein